LFVQIELVKEGNEDGVDDGDDVIIHLLLPIFHSLQVILNLLVLVDRAKNLKNH